jgi:hypothetical protein
MIRLGAICGAPTRKTEASTTLGLVECQNGKTNVHGLKVYRARAAGGGGGQAGRIGRQE